MTGTASLLTGFGTILPAVLCSALTGVFIQSLALPRRMNGVKRHWHLPLQLALLAFLAAFIFLILGKILFSCTGAALLVLALTVISNAKYRSLREPLVFSDYDYFTDAFRFPRLYFPFLGISGALGLVLAAGMAILGWELEDYSENHWSLYGDLPVIALIMSVSGAIIALSGKKLRDSLLQDPGTDLAGHGFIPMLYGYCLLYLKTPAAVSPFAAESGQVRSAGRLPDLIAVQSESFFDPRKLCPGIRGDLFGTFDRISSEASATGLMQVPSWGANTIRTEFSFLTGIAPELMGGHRFSPYQISSRSWQVASLTSFLKKQGYRTVCIHPFYAGFYHRNIIFKKWGFDEFQDIRSFAGIPADPEKSGPYIPDAALFERVIARYRELINESRDPVFIFVITMENHGPLNLEHITPEHAQRYFEEGALRSGLSGKAMTELAIYLRHLESENAVLERLIGFLNSQDREAVLTFYGDHVPILTETYGVFGDPPGLVPYFIWQNRKFRETEGGKEGVKAAPEAPTENPEQKAADVPGMRASELAMRTAEIMGFEFRQSIGNSGDCQ